MTDETTNTEQSSVAADCPNERLVRWRRDAHPYIERGEKCELWGHKVADMSKEDLISFIGFLDELATLRANGKAI